MDIYQQIKAAFGKAVPDLSEYFALTDRCRRIYAGEPEWRSVKKNGLYRSGNRSLALLNTAKVLCDRFAVFAFSEPPEVVCGSKNAGDLLRDVIEKTNLFGRMSEELSYAFAMGGCVFRPYLHGGDIGIDCVFGDGFIPTQWDSCGIYEGCFRSVRFKDGYRYTLLEFHGGGSIMHRLFRSRDSSSLGCECELSELYPELDEDAKGFGTPLFSCFKLAGANNIFPELPLGLSAFANAADTLKALDIAFDSFMREFVLGRKRIIVPSSCVQTVVDIATGEQRQYFDADDEAYVALKCDEERDLKITDNTVELRIDEHVKAINALLNILCFQVGLSAGTFSFDVNEGVKTATEIISRDSRTAATVRAHQNNLGGALKRLFRSVLQLGVCCGRLSPEDARCSIDISWHDGIITDENTIAENNIRLVNNGLKSRAAAIMEIQKCSLEDAERELVRISGEAALKGGEFNG